MRKTLERREVTAMVRRLAALRLLQPARDANYHAVKSMPHLTNTTPA